MPITKSGKDWKSLEAAAQQDDVAKVREIAGRLDLSDKKKYRNVCLAAAKAGASNALEVLLEAGKGFRFDNGWKSDRIYTDEMLKAAIASQNPAPLLSVIYATNKKEEGTNKLYEGDFINKDTPEDVIRSCLEKKPNLFENFVGSTGLNLTEDSTEKLKVILIYAATAPNPKSVLDNALITVAGTGDVEKTKLLLERQADPNTEAAQSLFEAGKNEHRDVVDLLLPLVTPELCRSVLERLQQRPEKNDGIIAAIETAAHRVITAQPAAATAPPQQPPLRDNFNRLSADALEETLPPDGTLKETVRYYFETRQQVFMTDGRPTLAVSFNNLPDGVETAMRARLNSLPNPEAEQRRPATLPLRLSHATTA